MRERQEREDERKSKRRRENWNYIDGKVLSLKTIKGRLSASMFGSLFQTRLCID